MLGKLRADAVARRSTAAKTPGTGATRQRLCGIVVNAHPNVSRPDYDRLKATLTNCRRHGVASQNREQHADFRGQLRGRVAWVEAVAPARGAKLRAIFEAIDWGETR